MITTTIEKIAFYSGTLYYHMIRGFFFVINVKYEKKMFDDKNEKKKTQIVLFAKKKNN